MTPSSTGLRIIFAGTPEFAAHHLQVLLNSSHQIVAVYTQPDRPAGRGKKLTPSPVKTLALTHELPVFQPVSLKNSEVQAELSEHNADVMVVVAYGLLLPKAVLEIPRYGCLNVHGSLLPRWRGAAPIQRAILGDEVENGISDNATGDSETGVTIMQMDVGLDTGDMLYKSACDIKPDETTASLHDKLMQLGGPALLATLEQVQQGQLQPEPQDNTQATYAEKITKQEAQIDWSNPATLIERKIRAYNPFPVAYTFLNGKRLKIYKATLVNFSDSEKTPGDIIAFNEEGVVVACGDGALALQQLQLPGKKSMSIAELMNGYSDLFSVGNYFGD